MNETCDCCEGTAQLTPLATANRPGLNTLAYRVGVHAAFLETMKARLSNFYLDIPRDERDENGQPIIERLYPLRGLTTRAADDPAIALLDAWATVGDVLTFYQERIANEGYLRTAIERRSILEIARLVGYTLRPGVAATVYLTYTLDNNFKEEVIIPAGARAQSVPGPGELPQSFETSEPLPARTAWNVLKPRMTRPQTEEVIRNGTGPQLYLKGISTNLKQNDPLLIDFGQGNRDFVRVKDIQPDAAADRTLVRLQNFPGTQLARAMAGQATISTEIKRQISDILARYLGPAADQSSLSRESKMFKTVSGYLESLRQQLAEDIPFPVMMVHLNDETLPKLEAERQIAAGPQYTHLRPWLERLITELSNVAANASTLRAESLLQPATFSSEGSNGDGDYRRDPFTNVLAGLTKPPSVPPANALQLQRSAATAFQRKADTGLQIIGAFRHDLRQLLPTAVANTKVAPDVAIKVYALRVKAALFGHNAPLQPKEVLNESQHTDTYRLSASPTIDNTWNELVRNNALEDIKIVALDAVYDQITPDSLVVIDQPTPPNSNNTHIIKIRQVVATQTHTMIALGLATKVTVLTLDKSWLDSGDGDSSSLRGMSIYAQNEELPLAEEPIDDPICGSNDALDTNALIELDGVYWDLQAGRWLIVSGERTDIQVTDPGTSHDVPVTGVKFSELVMLAEVIQQAAEQNQAGQRDSYYEGGEREPLPGEKTHTFIRLAADLEYCYKRDKVTIFGNVVKATHGETRNEVLGNGDGSQALQAFTLKQSPLTFVAAPNPRGVDSTLHVRVNEVEWHERDTLADLQPSDRNFITRTDDDAKTTVIFGNGRQGARLPTGAENIKAVYRNGIGKLGNVKADQISLLATRPLGVKEVINPLRASGGADKEGRDQARKNAPLAILALDRLVSTQDYADFARTFAGIGKASAARLSDGRRQLVFVTVAGADDIPIDKTSDLYRNLVKALRQFGDPHQPLQVELRELLLLVISARVRLLPDYLWEAVVLKIRAQLLDTFSFERRELAQDVVLSEVISVMQAIEGVAYVDVDLLRGIPEKTADLRNPGQRRLLTPDEIAAQVNEPLFDAAGNTLKEPLPRLSVNSAGFEEGTIRPAQIAFLTPDVAATLILNEIK